MEEAYSIELFKCTRRAVAGRDGLYSGVVQGGSLGGSASYYSSESTQGDPFDLIYKFNVNLMRSYGGLEVAPKVTERKVLRCSDAFQATLRLDNGLVAQHACADEFEAQAHALKAALEQTRAQNLLRAQPFVLRASA